MKHIHLFIGLALLCGCSTQQLSVPQVSVDEQGNHCVPVQDDGTIGGQEITPQSLVMSDGSRYEVWDGTASAAVAEWATTLQVPAVLDKERYTDAYGRRYIRVTP